MHTMLWFCSLVSPFLELSLLLGCLKTQTPQLEERPGAPRKLDADGLQSVIRSLEPSIVAYVVPACGHSIPQFIKAASALEIGHWLPAYYVECDNATVSHLCPAYTCSKAVDGRLAKLPDVQVLPWQIKTNLETTTEELLGSVSEHVPSFIDKLPTRGGVIQWVKKYDGIHRILVATEDGDVPDTWKIFAFKYLGRARFATIKSSILAPKERRNPWKFRIHQAKTEMIVTVHTDLDFDHLARQIDGLDSQPIYARIWDKLKRTYRKLWMGL